MLQRRLFSGNLPAMFVSCSLINGRSQRSSNVSLFNSFGGLSLTIVLLIHQLFSNSMRVLTVPYLSQLVDNYDKVWMSGARTLWANHYLKRCFEQFTLSRTRFAPSCRVAFLLTVFP